MMKIFQLKNVNFGKNNSENRIRHYILQFKQWISVPKIFKNWILIKSVVEPLKIQTNEFKY